MSDLNYANTSTMVGDVTAREHYYFKAEVPGTFEITIDTFDASFIYDETSCPEGYYGYTSGDLLTLTFDEPTDFMITVIPGKAASLEYTLTVIFTPAYIYDMDIEKRNVPNQVKNDADTTVRYTFTVTSNNTFSVTDFTLSDTLPADLYATGINFTDHGIMSCSSNGATINCDCASGCSLDAGSSTTVEFEAIVHPTSTGDIINTVDLNMSNGQNFSASSTIEVYDPANKPLDLEVFKFAEASIIPLDMNFSYAIFVVNYGVATDSHGIHIEDLFPIDYVDYIDINESTGWSCTLTGPNLSCDFSQTLEKNSFTSFVIHAKTRTEVAYTGQGISIPILNVPNIATVTAIDNLSGDRSLSTQDDINISNYGGTGVGGLYSVGGSIEISDYSPTGWTRADAKIYTKVASKENMALRTYFLSSTTGGPMAYPGNVTLNDKNTIPLTVIFKLAEEVGTNQCREFGELGYNGGSVRAEFLFGISETYVGIDLHPDDGSNPTFQLSNIAIPKARILMKYLDLNKAFADTGEGCNPSSIDGNVKGIPSCITNSTGATKFDRNKYFKVFGIAAYTRCVMLSGSPCEPSNHGYGDYPYDHEYGCYECTIGNAGYCSQDNFAIRPDRFEVKFPDGTDVDGSVFRAGNMELFSSRAFTANTSNLAEETKNYNEDQNDTNATFYVDANVSNNTYCQIKSLEIDPKVDFTDGRANGTPGFSFDDVGKINFSIHETNGTEFAKVDADDTPLLQDRLIKRVDINFTVIPDHLEINTTLSDHNSANNFTYISADLDMSSKLDINITAQGGSNLTTFNYTENCYAYPIDLNISLAYDPDPTTPNTLSPILYLLKAEGSTIALDGNSPNIKLISGGNMVNINTSIFPAGDHNGTAILSAKLNFDRKYHEVVNPFEMDVTEINATDDDTNTSGVIQYVKGTGAPDDNATYYYGRAKSSRYFYDDVMDSSSITTPISVVVYRDPSTSSFGLDLTLFKPTNENEWYLSTGHSTGNNDGNITLEALSGGSVSPADPTVVAITNGINNAVTVSSSGGALPEIVNITFGPDTNTWMIYNEDNNSVPTPFYRVRFTESGNWTGHGQTGHVVGDDINKKKTRRLEW